MEKSRDLGVFLNGNQLEVDESLHWMENCFQGFPAAMNLQNGDNTVRLRMNFHQDSEVWERVRKGAEYESEVNMLGFDTEVESIYIRGKFLVRPSRITETTRGDEALEGSRDMWAMRGDAVEAIPPFTICDMPDKLTSRDATMSGFPFYNGRMNFHRIYKSQGSRNRRTSLAFERLFAAAGRLLINDKFVGDLLWSTPEVDVTDHLVDGSNRITVELTTTNRNIFGPHHHPLGELFAVGPEYFGEVPDWNPNYNLVRLSPGVARIKSYNSSTGNET